MYYSYQVTPPTKIECVADYKERIYEITHGQMRNIVLKERLLNPFFWLFSVIAIPMSVAYFLLCLCEIIVDTILLPFFCIPIVRYIPFLVSVVVWSLGIAIGIFAFVPLTYDVDYRPKRIKGVSSATAMKRIMIAEQIDVAQKMYIYYGVGSRFNDDMGILSKEYENIINNCNEHNVLSSAPRWCKAISLYYLFDLWKIYKTDEDIVGLIAKIIFREKDSGKPYKMSFLHSKAWGKARKTLVDKINGLISYQRIRYTF